MTLTSLGKWIRRSSPQVTTARARPAEPPPQLPSAGPGPARVEGWREVSSGHTGLRLGAGRLIVTRTRGRVGARAPGRARGTGQGGAGARTRLSARPEGRAGTLGSHALRLPGARAPLPLPTRCPPAGGCAVTTCPPRCPPLCPPPGRPPPR